MQMLMLTFMFMAIPMFLIFFFPIFITISTHDSIYYKVYYYGREKALAFYCLFWIYLIVFYCGLIANILVIPAMLISSPFLLAYLIVK